MSGSTACERESLENLILRAFVSPWFVGVRGSFNVLNFLNTRVPVMSLRIGTVSWTEHTSDSVFW